MNSVIVAGGKKDQRELAEKIVNWCIKKMMPRMRTLDIEVKLKDLKGEAFGYCMQGDDNRTYELEIDKNLSLYDFFSTITHEMVHVKQYARNEIRFDEKTGANMWKRSRVSQNTSYMDLPWEKEAFRLERGLALECFQEIA
jgi:uncharacterized protein YjaZ